MKKTSLLIAILACLATACSKDIRGTDNTANSNSPTKVDDNPNGGGGNNIPAASVPAAVMNAYKSRFANATQAEWKLLSNGTYKVQFYQGAVRWEAIFSASGSLLKLEKA